jgi:hypothetical protein
MWHRIILCALAGLIFCSGSGRAQGVCGDRDEIVAALEQTYGERKTAVALSGGGGLVELYTAADGRWTLLYTAPAGPTCLLAAGEAWQSWATPVETPKTRTH